MTSPGIEKPFIICSGGDFKQMLIQTTISAAPKIDKQTAGPRKDDIAIMNDVVWPNTWRAEITCHIAKNLSKFFDFQHGKSIFSVIWAKTLHRKTIQVCSNIRNYTGFPSYRHHTAEWFEIYEPRLENGLCHLL